MTKKIFGYFLWTAFLLCLLTLSIVRFAFIQHYGQDLLSTDICSALQRGFLFDAKWAAVALLPALLLLILSLLPHCKKLQSIAKVVTIVSGCVIFLLALVNFAFSAFTAPPSTP